jgi:hypothetical protein
VNFFCFLEIGIGKDRQFKSLILYLLFVFLYIYTRKNIVAKEQVKNQTKKNQEQQKRLETGKPRSENRNQADHRLDRKNGNKKRKRK